MPLYKNLPLWIILLVLIFAGGYFILFGEEIDERQQRESVNVGVILPLSGDLSFIGTEIRRGMDMALTELGSESLLELIYEDDQTLDSQTAVNAAQS